MCSSQIPMGCRTICFCCIFFFLLFTSPFVILVTLNYVGTEPRFYIQELYIPAFNNSHTYNNATNLNSSIIIDLKFKRVVAFVPIRYQDLNITLYYGQNRSFSVGHYVVAGFSQGKKKTVRRTAVVEALGLPWEDAFQKISGGSKVALVVELATKYQLKRCGEDDCYYTKPKAAVTAADVEVDGSGVEVSNKAIRLH